MATTVYMSNQEPVGSLVGTGQYYQTLEGGMANALSYYCGTGRGNGATSFILTTRVGPTPGQEVGSPDTVSLFVSAPLATDVTISGQITFNLWGQQSSMSTNSAINMRVMRLNALTGVLTPVHLTVRSTELTTSYAVNNWNETPSSGTAFNKGDRLVLVPFFDDGGGTLGDGYYSYLSAGAASGGVEGDSYLTFTETFSFESAPSGTTIYPTTSSSSVSSSGVSGSGWADNSQGSSASYAKVKYRNGYWVTVGAIADYVGLRWHATDPTGTWTTRDASGGGNIYGYDWDGTYHAIIANAAYSIRYSSEASPDGGWTNNTNTGWSWTGSAYDLCYGNGYWVACAATTVSVDMYYTTNPTGTWTGNDQGVSLRGLTYANGYWCGVGDSGAIRYKATDPSGTWSSASGGAGNLRAVAYGNGNWAAVSDNGSVFYRTNSDPSGTWTAGYDFLDAGSVYPWGIAYDNGVWVVTCSSGFIYWTTDITNGTGSAWDKKLLDSHASNLRSAAYSGGYWTVTGEGSSIFYWNPTELEAWTSRGSGATTAVTSTVNGGTPGLQITGTSTGTAIDWYTKPLQATTLSGPVLVHMRCLESSSSANAAFRWEIAKTAGDGSSATLWGTIAPRGEPQTFEDVMECWIGGDDLSISDGERIRIRAYLDDAYWATSLSLNSMASGYTATLYYAGSAGASGDTYLTFPITLTEYSPPAAAMPPRSTLYPQMLAH